MRIVLDTNVLISGIFFSGVPFQILDAWRHGRIELATSPEILDEYARVAHELQTKFPEIDPYPVLALVMVDSHVTQAPPLPRQVCDDPTDDKFLACAISSGTRIVVSGDKALLRATGYRGVQVLPPVISRGGTSRELGRAVEQRAEADEAGYHHRRSAGDGHHGSHAAVQAG